MSSPSTLIAETIEKLADELVELRRDLHAHPELSWSEVRTTDADRHPLEEAGWRVRRMPRSGLIAEVGESGPLVALRADLDALPVEDRTDDPWASTVAGVAHACGHDVHTTALVGAGAGPGRGARRAASCTAGSGCSSSPPRRSCPAAR